MTDVLVIESIDRGTLNVAPVTVSFLLLIPIPIRCLSAHDPRFLRSGSVKISEMRCTVALRD